MGEVDGGGGEGGPSSVYGGEVYGDRQSGEFIRKAEGMIESLDIRPVGDGYNKLSLLLPNGSRIVGLPASEGRVRGFSGLSMLVIDEASRVGDELYRELRP